MISSKITGTAGEGRALYMKNNAAGSSGPLTGMGSPGDFVARR